MVTPERARDRSLALSAGLFSPRSLEEADSPHFTRSGFSRSGFSEGQRSPCLVSYVRRRKSRICPRSGRMSVACNRLVTACYGERGRAWLSRYTLGTLSVYCATRSESFATAKAVTSATLLTPALILADLLVVSRHSLPLPEDPLPLGLPPGARGSFAWPAGRLGGGIEEPDQGRAL